MILQRLATSIRKQDWFTVAIETLIVVFGVFIGLQVNNWNEARQSRIEERGYLERLAEDISVSIEQNERRIEFMDRQDRNITVALERLSRCEFPIEDRDTVASAFFHVGKSLPPALVRGVINELNATGKFQFISNAEIRDAVTAMTEAVDSAGVVFATTLARGNPHVVYVESQIEYKLSGARQGDVDIVWGDIAFDQQFVCSDLRFRKALSAARYYTNGMNKQVIEVANAQRALLTMIRSELAP